MASWVHWSQLKGGFISNRFILLRQSNGRKYTMILLYFCFAAYMMQHWFFVFICAPPSCQEAPGYLLHPCHHVGQNNLIACCLFHCAAEMPPTTVYCIQSIYLKLKLNVNSTFLTFLNIWITWTDPKHIKVGPPDVDRVLFATSVRIHHYRQVQFWWSEIII